MQYGMYVVRPPIHNFSLDQNGMRRADRAYLLMVRFHFSYTTRIIQTRLDARCVCVRIDWPPLDLHAYACLHCSCTYCIRIGSDPALPSVLQSVSLLAHQFANLVGDIRKLRRSTVVHVPEHRTGEWAVLA